MSALKVLVCGDVEGHFKSLFSKITSIHTKKGPFEYLLCVGNFFGANNDEWKDVLSGKISAPLTTYILGPTCRDHSKFYPDDSDELAPNIIYLGKRGILTGSSGLKIAYLSGSEDKDSSSFSFNKKDVTELIAGMSSAVDVLMTSQWPKGVSKYAKEVSGLSDEGSSSIAQLAKLLKPRYHFSGVSGVYYERLPYRNHQVLQELPVPPTRFIGLAPVVNDNKFKWLYAFNITPLQSMKLKELNDVSGPTTECPFGVEESKDQFFYDMDSPSDGKKRHQNEDGRPHKKKPLSVEQGKCWFCLTNPDLEKQLILSIGDHSYITLAKGGIVSDHLLIIPLEHIPAAVDLSEESGKEVNDFKMALVKYFHDRRKDVIVFERNYVSPHLQLQIVPISKSRTSGILESILDFASDQHGLELTELSSFTVLKHVVPPKKPYFYVEVFINKESKGRLLHIIEGKFPLQFGRMMLASKSILNAPERVDWKECKLSEEEELRAAKEFRKNFEPYDFTKT